MSFCLKTWRTKRTTTIALLRKLANELDRMEKNVNISKLTGSSAGIVSGIGAVGCLLAAPFTGGLSALGIIPFVGLGVAGGAVNIGARLGKYFHEKDLIEKVQAALEDDRRESINLNQIKQDIEFGQGVAIGINAVTKVVAPALSAVEVVAKSVVVVNLARLPLDIFNLIETSIEVDGGSINKCAREVRKIAEELEEELEKFKCKFYDTDKVHTFFEPRTLIFIYDYNDPIFFFW